MILTYEEKQSKVSSLLLLLFFSLFKKKECRAAKVLCLFWNASTNTFLSKRYRKFVFTWGQPYYGNMHF